MMSSNLAPFDNMPSSKGVFNAVTFTTLYWHVLDQV